MVAARSTADGVERRGGHSAGQERRGEIPIPRRRRAGGAGRTQIRCGVPRAARPLRRGRHDPGTARARQPALCGCRRARVGGGHGQSGDESALRRARVAALRVARVGARRLGPLAAARARRSETARLPDVRETGQPRLERRHLESEIASRPGAGHRTGAGVRSKSRGRGRGAERARDRMRGARQRRARRLAPGRDHPVSRVLRL